MLICHVLKGGAVRQARQRHPHIVCTVKTAVGAMSNNMMYNFFFLLININNTKEHPIVFNTKEVRRSQTHLN